MFFLVEVVVRDLQHPLGMAPAQFVLASRLAEPLERELANGLEHPVALLAERSGAAAEQALVEQGGERAEIGVAHQLRGLERAASAEHAEAREQHLLVLVEQVVRPRNRRPQRHVPFLGVARSLQRVEAVGEPVEESLGREQLRPGGGELERERQAVEPFAELHDGVRGGDVRPHGLRALAEERHGLVADERREVELGLTLDPQRLAARREQPQGGHGGDELGQRTGGVRQELLEVVADHVRASFADAGGDRRRIRRRRAEPVGHRRQDELRVSERPERDEDRSSLRVVAEQARELDREARLAGSSQGRRS